MGINYSLGVEETYAAFAIACMIAKMGVRILETAIARHRSQQDGDWPSWVPHWRTPRDKPVFLYTALKPLSETYVLSGKPDYGGGIQVRALFLGIPMEPQSGQKHRPEIEHTVLFPRVVRKSDRGICESLPSTIDAVCDLSHWHYEQGGAMCDCGNGVNQVNHTDDIDSPMGQFTEQLINRILELARMEKRWTFNYSLAREVPSSYCLEPGMTLPPEVKIADYTVFMAINATPPPIFSKSCTTHMLVLGSRGVRDGDRLYIVGPLINPFRRNDPVYNGHHAVILRPCGDVSDTYKVVGEVILLGKILFRPDATTHTQVFRLV